VEALRRASRSGGVRRPYASAIEIRDTMNKLDTLAPQTT